MSLKNIANFSKIYFEKLPVYLIFYVTSKCNYRCKMCFYWQHIDKPDKNELALDEIEKISKNFGRLLQLSLTGGEPFLRNDLAEIVRIFVKNNNPIYVTIPTNASNPERILHLTEKILSQNPGTFFRIPLSIDGLYGDHDEIRGHRGAFEELLTTYRTLFSLKQHFHNLVLDINIAYSFYNQHKITEIIDFVSKNFEADNLSVTLVRGNVRDKQARVISTKEYERIIASLISLKKRREIRPMSWVIRSVFEHTWEVILKTLKRNTMVLPCSAGRRIIIIDEEGAVFPCEIIGKELGNLRDFEYNISEILNSKKAKEILRYVKQTRCFCTFECAMVASIAFNFATYPALALKVIKNFLLESRNEGNCSNT